MSDCPIEPRIEPRHNWFDTSIVNNSNWLLADLHSNQFNGWMQYRSEGKQLINCFYLISHIVRHISLLPINCQHFYTKTFKTIVNIFCFIVWFKCLKMSTKMSPQSEVYLLYEFSRDFHVFGWVVVIMISYYHYKWFYLSKT